MIGEGRFWAKVGIMTTPCWVFNGGHISSGYGAFHPVHGQTVLAHRYAYEDLVSPIPDGMSLDHKCRNRSCVNPDHLEVVTLAENTRRAGNTIKTECRNGHPYTPENTYRDGRGSRRCRECSRIYEANRPRRTRRNAA